jgi:hypothetical protein
MSSSLRHVALGSLAAGSLAAGCAAKAGRTEISAFPSLTSLHEDPEKRAAQLDSAEARPGPEQNKGKTQKELKAETALATLAAIVGSFHSTSPNVVIGTRTPFDENQLFVNPPDASSLLPKLSLAPSLMPQGALTSPATWLMTGLGWIMNWDSIAVPEPPREEEPPAGWLPGSRPAASDGSQPQSP